MPPVSTRHEKLKARLLALPPERRQAADALLADNTRLVGVALRQLVARGPRGKEVIDALGGWEDAFGEGVLKQYELAARFDPERAKFSTFAVKSVVRHLCAVAKTPIRRSRGLPRARIVLVSGQDPLDVFLWDEADPEPEFPAEASAEVSAAMGLLKKANRKLLEQHYLRGKSLLELASVYRVSKQAMHQRVVVALDRCRGILFRERLRRREESRQEAAGGCPC